MEFPQAQAPYDHYDAFEDLMKEMPDWFNASVDTAWTEDAQMQGGPATNGGGDSGQLSTSGSQQNPALASNSILRWEDFAKDEPGTSAPVAGPSVTDIPTISHMAESGTASVAPTTFGHDSVPTTSQTDGNRYIVERITELNQTMI